MTYVKAAAMQSHPLTTEQRAQWNAYIDYLQAKGMKGNPALDNRDTKLSQQMFDSYKAQNPHFTLTYDQVPQVQKDLLDYRAQLVNKWKANPAVVPDAKTEEDIMPDLSPADGWLGSKTSSHKYPVAQLNQTSYGTNLNAYDAAIAKIKSGK